jgi:hypothetical protein
LFQSKFRTVTMNQDPYVLGFGLFICAIQLQSTEVVKPDGHDSYLIAARVYWCFEVRRLCSSSADAISLKAEPTIS